MRAFRSGLRNPIQRAGDRLGSVGILGQFLRIDGETPSYTTGPVPAGAYWAFFELLGRGGHSLNTQKGKGGGGAGNDAILSVSPGETFTVLGGRDGEVSKPTVILRGSTELLRANAGGSSTGSNPTGAGGAGKYPGSSGGTGDGLEGLGGGRLAGKVRGANSKPPGQGAYSSYDVGPGANCITFVASYDEALAFAKAVYGGSWTP